MHKQITTVLVLACLTFTPQFTNAQNNTNRQVAVSIKVCERVSETSKVMVVANPTIVAKAGKSFSMHSGGTVKPKIGKGKLEFGTQVSGALNYSDNDMIEAALKICLGTHKQSDSSTDIVLSETLEIRATLKPEKTRKFAYSQSRWCEVQVQEVRTRVE